MQNKKLILHIIFCAFILSFVLIANSAFDNSKTSVDFHLNVTFVSPISLAVGVDVVLNDVVGGDIIDKDISMSAVKASSRSATCSATPLVLSSPGESDITAINASVNPGCTIWSLNGTVPEDVKSNKSFSGTITITYAYDPIVHN